MLSHYKQDGKLLKNVRISNTTVINAMKNLKLSDNIFIGHYNFIEASNGITIEEGCQITNFITITTHSSHISIRLYGSEYVKNHDLIGYIIGSIHIGKYSFIGPHSVIMPGSNIGKGSIVSAYSYVKGTFPDYAIISGNPAIVVGDTREMDKEFLENYPQLKTFYDAWTQ
jgi:acetyltransferase-like isoleucine patch superfamily enzyme